MSTATRADSRVVVFRVGTVQPQPAWVDRLLAASMRETVTAMRGGRVGCVRRDDLVVQATMAVLRCVTC